MRAITASFLWRAVALAVLLSIGSAAVGSAARGDAGERPAGVNLAEIIELHTEARGGAAAIEAVETIEFELSIVEPTFEVEALYRATRSGKMRIDVYAGGERVFTEGYDGARGWQLPGGATTGKDMVAGGEAALRHGIAGNVFGLHEMVSLGHRLEYRGRETIDGIEYYVIDLVYAEGAVLRNYIDPRTWLVGRTRQDAALHPDVDPTIQRFETIMSDTVEIAGVTFARQTRKRDLDSGEIVQTTFAKKITINPEIDAAQFERPE